MRPRTTVSCPIHARALRRAVSALTAGFVTLGLGACTVTTENGATTTGPGNTVSVSTPITPEIPNTDLAVLASNLTAPTGIAVTDTGLTLLTMGSTITAVTADSVQTTIEVQLKNLAEAPQPLRSIALAGDYATSGAAFLCYQTDSDLRVARIIIDERNGTAREQTTLVTGIPLPAGTGSGCELALGPDGRLYVGTSDANRPQAPQDLTSLGGKILRVDPLTGAAPPDNPFVDRSEPNTRLIYSLGHRDITGLAWHPGTQVMFAIDQGPGREDEVNVIVPGGNYGWNPASASTSSYQPSAVPMTDLNITNARPAAYNSGTSAAGLAAATFIQGPQWGAWAGNLAITNANSGRITVLPITGEIVGQPATFEAAVLIGPSEAITADAAGALYLSTATGQHDRLLRLQAK